MKTTSYRFFLLILTQLLASSLVYCQVNENSNNSEIKIIDDYDRFEHFAEILSLREFENKVIYIDIWVTGCSPCIAEFKHLPELKKRYKNKHVVFLYLARSYGLFRISRWKKEMQKEKLEGYHIFMTENLKDTIKAEIPGLSRGYPKFILIDKEGDIAYPAAPRPSSGKELYKLIDKLLDKQLTTVK